MKEIAKIKLSSFWLILFFAIVTITAMSVVHRASASLQCNDSGYCWDTGTRPSGGKCGPADKESAHWDTCYGLSWQYYEWPAGWDNDIIFYGSENSGGDATIAAKCKDYGGFWFLGYEAYIPKTGKSLGYQIAKPKAGMLADYDYGGRTPLYPYDNLADGANADAFKPTANKYIPQKNPGLSSLVGVKYGNAEEVRDLFLTLIDEEQDISNTSSFSEASWFCAAETPPDRIVPPPDYHPEINEEPDPDDPSPTLTSYARGRSIVKSDDEDDNWARTAWSNNGDVVRINVAMMQGETRDITFKHRVTAEGKLAQPIGYRVTDSTDNTLAEGFYNYDGVDMDESALVYTDGITVFRSGTYCETLTITYERPIGTQYRTSTACVDVTVNPLPPEMFGRVEVTIGNQTVSSEWNGGVENPAVLDVTIQEGDTVDVVFNDYIKAVDGSDTKLRYEIKNSYYLGRSKNGYLDYTVATDSGVEQEVQVTSVDRVGKKMTICETMHYWAGGEDRSAQACARIILNKRARTLGSPEAGTAFINFSAQINPYISITVESPNVYGSGSTMELVRNGTTICVSTNNVTGYTATISSNSLSSEENGTSLYNRYSKVYIPTLPAPVLKSEFPDNGWGFSFDDTEEGDNNSTYNNLKPLDAPNPYIFSEKDEAGEEEIDVYFAAKIDVSKNSGTYSSGVALRAVAGIIPYLINDIADIQYMQDINDNVINSMVVNQQYKLYDQRDGKSYWVAKMEDGTVWMTQNLDYELKNGDRLFEGDTDISHRSGSTASYLDVPRSTSVNALDPWMIPNNNSENSLSKKGVLLAGGHSYRPESDTVYYMPTYSITNDNDGTISQTVHIPRYTAYGNDGKLIYDSKAACEADWSAEQCEHWSVGIYYSPTIAHGDIFDTSTNTSERNTICPSRWTLPTSAEYQSLLSNKTLTDLHGAPYYLTSSGLYGGRSSTKAFSQWYVGLDYITYLDKDGDTIMSYPAGLTPTTVYSNPTYSSESSKRVSSGTMDGLGATIRCIARKGY